MIRAIIIDDEQNNIDNLRKLLQNYCPDLTIVDEALNADDAEKIIPEQKPDIVFLDVQLPGKSGFDILKSLPSYSFEIIFVTAFDKYGIQAIKFSAIDYILKPINIEELKMAVSKATEKIKQKKQNLQLENLLQLLKHNQEKEDHRIALPVMKEIRFVKTQDIVRCESSNNYTTFYLVNDEKLTVSKPIYEYEELLMQRAIQAESFDHRLAVFGGRVLGQHQIDRIAGEAAEEKHDRRDQHQQNDALQ